MLKSFGENIFHLGNVTPWVCIEPTLKNGGGVLYIWVFPKIKVPQNGWFLMENPVKMDDFGVSLFSETPIYIYIYMFFFLRLTSRVCFGNK